MEQKKTHIVCVRLSDRDYNELKKYCIRYRTKISKLIQRLIFQFLK